MLYQAIAAQRRWEQQPEVEGPKLTKDPEASRANTIGDRYAKALAMVEPWAKRTPRTWPEVSAAAADHLIDRAPSKQTILRWAARRSIILKPKRPKP